MVTHYLNTGIANKQQHYLERDGWMDGWMDGWEKEEGRGLEGEGRKIGT